MPRTIYETPNGDGEGGFLTLDGKRLLTPSGEFARWCTPGDRQRWIDDAHRKDGAA